MARPGSDWDRERFARALLDLVDSVNDLAPGRVTLSAIAARNGGSKQTVSGWLSGKSMPRDEDALRAFIHAVAGLADGIGELDTDWEAWQDRFLAVKRAEAGMRRRRRRAGAAAAYLANRPSMDSGYLREYLGALADSLSETARWLPHRRIEAGFEDRKVLVRHRRPEGAEGGLLYRPALSLPYGDVSWNRAVDGARAVVLLGDAGMGKTWLLRDHGRRLSLAALAAFDEAPAGSELATLGVPLWMHASDLGRAWVERPGAGGIVTAALAEPRRRGLRFTEDIATMLQRLIIDGALVHVIVDAYDEVHDDEVKESAIAGLQWLGHRVSERGGPHIVLASRPAGFDDPFARVLDEDSALEPRYLHLGVLDEPQVRHLWRQWSQARGRALPLDRLEPALAPGSPLRQFVHVPLVAAFCAWVAEQDTVATTRTGLYQQVLRRFLALAWKGGQAGSGRSDIARQRLWEPALADLGWSMATTQSGWRAAVPVERCEKVLAERGPAPLAGHSRTWELVRQVGVLVQAGAAPDELLGDAPVSFIHRSMQEFLVAHQLVTLTSGELQPVVDQAWCDAAWRNVLEFAVGIESGARRAAADAPRDPESDRPVRDALFARAVGSYDGLGWFTTTLLSAGEQALAGLDDPGTLVDKVWRLHAAGVVSEVQLVQALGYGGDVGHEHHLVEVLEARLRDGGPTAALWAAIAWAGPTGRAALAEKATSALDGAGAAAVLHRVDPEAGLTALRARLRAGLAIDVQDSALLSDLDEASMAAALARYRADPGSATLAQTVGLSHRPDAHAALTERVDAEDPASRVAAARGLLTWYGMDLDRDCLAILLELALHDESPAVRTEVRGMLQQSAHDLAWVQSALYEVWTELYSDPDEPALDDLDAIAARLRSIGPATHTVVTMVALEPSLMRGPVAEAMHDLTERVLRGEIEPELAADVIKLGGIDVLRLACERLHRLDGPATAVCTLARAVGIAAAGHPDAFDALLTASRNSPDPSVAALLAVHETPRLLKVIEIARAMLALAEPRPASVALWTDLLNRLTAELSAPERGQVRGVCAAATDHVLKWESGARFA